MSRPVCLIVDDEPEIRAYLKAILQRKDIDILEASNSVQALQAVHKIGGIDLVITDIQMPGEMDGVDLANSLKTSHPTLPVILISGFANVPMGRLKFIQKPFLPETILETIEDLLISAPKTERENAGGGNAA